jgi:hypothetical protein
VEIRRINPLAVVLVAAVLLTTRADIRAAAPLVLLGKETQVDLPQIIQHQMVIPAAVAAQVKPDLMAFNPLVLARAEMVFNLQLPEAPPITQAAAVAGLGAPLLVLEAKVAALQETVAVALHLRQQQ